MGQLPNLLIPASCFLHSVAVVVRKRAVRSGMDLQRRG